MLLLATSGLGDLQGWFLAFRFPMVRISILFIIFIPHNRHPQQYLKNDIGLFFHKIGSIFR